LADVQFAALIDRDEVSGPCVGPDGKPRPKGSPLLEMDFFAKIPATCGNDATSGQSIEVMPSSITKECRWD
jgi:hypothetical protein